MAVDPVTSTDSSTYATSSSSSGSSNLSVDSQTFLELLVAQLQYQDPMEPQSNTEFVSQLAQMTSIEQLESMNSSMQSSQAYAMIGKYVYAEELNSTTGVTNAYSGQVDSVVMDSGTAYVVINGTPVPVSDVLQVSNTDTTDSSGETGTESA